MARKISQKRRIRKAFDRWHKCLGLGWWHIDMIYETDRSKFKSREDEYEVVAKVATRWEYRTATITFNMALVQDRTDAELEVDVLHEMVHPLVAEMQQGESDDYYQHCERVICTLVNALMWSRAEGYKEGRAAQKKKAKAR